MFSYFSVYGSDGQHSIKTNKHQNPSQTHRLIHLIVYEFADQQYKFTKKDVKFSRVGLVARQNRSKRRQICQINIPGEGLF